MCNQPKDFSKSGDPFMARLVAAQDAGLNAETCKRVAFGEITLEQALGDMDMDQESSTDIYDDETGFVYCNEECKEFGGCLDCIPFW